MIKNNDIIFLIRTYNEWKYLLDTIEKIKKAWYEKILVVDDGSKDGTKEILETRSDIYYIRHLINLWAGAALETGFEFIRRNYKTLQIKYVVSFDADGQHQIQDLENFKQVLEEDNSVDVVLWSRFINNTAYNIPFTRKIILLLWNIFTFFLSNIKVSDPHNGYKMFTINAIEKIYLTIDNFAYASELIDQIAKNKLKFVEVPVNIVYTDYSLSKWQKSLNAINIALKMIWSKFFK